MDQGHQGTLAGPGRPYYRNVFPWAEMQVDVLQYLDTRHVVEADTLEQAEAAAKAGANIILLDNMPPEMLREAVALIDGRSQTEASGGITLNNIRAVAETGVNYISVGALTHSAMAVDIAMDFSPTP
jgi:nicotinate-nucleotide pyrophosphorylase